MRRLKEIVQEFNTELENAENNKLDYDSAAWPYKQAHRNGQRAAYLKLNELLNWINS